ncbi:E4 [Canis familiaris papillomavirus 16]|uniref:E4 n=1 Tax=Canis familiaris papillomavirus 16 TaxID=1619253 RepID=A0A0C5KR79_9PAPI|nr:E4 [Canis familiaris papillomavirus 16]AJP70545.1 E4 [Canis familiaris papillomavirus 16]AVZ46187.1 E4 [Chipapillomavirus 2]
MTLSPPLTLSPALHRPPPTLVRRLKDLLTGNQNGWPEEVELQHIRRPGPKGQITPPASPPRPRRRHRSRRNRTPSPVFSWEDPYGESQTPPPGSPLLTPHDRWSPQSQPTPLSPCPGASPLPLSTPESTHPPTPYQGLDLDLPRPLPRPTPLPLRDPRPSLSEQKKALKQALDQVSKDAYLLRTELLEDLDSFFAKLGIVPHL